MEVCAVEGLTEDSGVGRGRQDNYSLLNSFVT